jgi:hypothetical protein
MITSVQLGKSTANSDSFLTVILVKLLLLNLVISIVSIANVVVHTPTSLHIPSNKTVIE